MAAEPGDVAAERPPMRRIDFGDGHISISIDPRHDPGVQKNIRGQALAIVGGSLCVLAIVFAIPLVVHLFRLSHP